jgi:hypothetical protein
VKHMCFALAVISGLSFALTGTAVASSPGAVIASAGATENVWRDVEWVPTKGQCDSDGQWWVRQGAAAYTCEWDPHTPGSSAYPWLLRVFD